MDSLSPGSTDADVANDEEGSLRRIRILIADDSETAAHGLQSMIERQPDIEVVGIVKNGIEAMSTSEWLQPDLILMDAQMPEMDGIQASLEIKQRWPHIQILFMAVHPVHIRSALSAGVDSYIMKDSQRPEYLAAIRRLAAPLRENRTESNRTEDISQ